MMKKRIVVKIGSSSLTDYHGEIDAKKLFDHVQALAALRQANHEVVLVSSGAVASGFKKLGYSSRPVTIKGKQAAAAVGQSLLIQSYIKMFQEFELIPAQLLLTRRDFSHPESYKNAFATITELLERGIIPIINENDTVAIEELTFGDNDMLSALVSGFIHANQLIILTDINGLYNANPHTNPSAKRYNYLKEISEDMMNAASSTGSKFGTGGMKSKLEAAKTAISLGVPVFIGSGYGRNKLLQVIEGNGDGTYIANKKVGSIKTSKQWIALHSPVDGRVYIDKGAEQALLLGGRSLLPAGIYKIEGIFKEDDVVEVYGLDGLLGKGKVTRSSEVIEHEMNERVSNQSKSVIEPTVEVIHRNNWVQL